MRQGGITAKAVIDESYSGDSWFFFAPQSALSNTNGTAAGDGTLAGFAHYLLGYMTEWNESLESALSDVSWLAAEGEVIAIGRSATASNGTVEYDITYYQYGDGIISISNGPELLSESYEADYLFIDPAHTETPVGETGVKVTGGTLIPPPQRVHIAKPKNGAYAPDMTFPELTVTGYVDSVPLVKGSDYTVGWTAGTGTIEGGVPTSTGTYSATVSILDTNSYIRPTDDIVYTVEKATPYVVVPSKMTVVYSGATPDSVLRPGTNTGFTAQHSEENRTSVPGTFRWITGGSFSEENLTHTVLFTPSKAMEQSYSEATAEYTFTMQKEIPAVTELTMALDEATGGIRITFTEPTGPDAEHIDQYKVRLYEKGQNTEILVGVVAKDAGGTGIVAGFDIIRGGKTYTAQITSVPDGPPYITASSTRMGEITVPKTTLAITGSTANLPDGYTADAPENSMSLTVANTGTPTAVDIQLPTLDARFVSGDWSTEPFALATGAEKTFHLSLAAGQAYGAQTWSVAVSGANFDTAEGTVTAHVAAPQDAVTAVTLDIPAQPQAGDPLTPHEGVTLSGSTPQNAGMLAASVTEWSGKASGTWSAGEIPRLLVTVRANEGFTLPTLRAEQVTLTGPGADRAEVERVTVTDGVASITIRYQQYVQTSSASALAAQTTASGGVKITFTEPTFRSGIKHYLVSLYTKGTAEHPVATATVALNDGKDVGASFELSSSLSADGVSEYSATVTGVPSDPVRYFPSYATLAGVKPEQAVVKLTASTPDTLNEGYTQGEQVITMTLENTGSMKAWGIVWPAPEEPFVPAADSLPWDEAAVNLAAGEKSVRKLTLKGGQVTGTYEWLVQPTEAPSGVCNIKPVTGQTARQVVVPRPPQLLTVEYEGLSTTYNGNAQGVKITAIRDADGTVELLEGTDYEVHYTAATQEQWSTQPPIEVGAYMVRLVLTNGAELHYIAPEPAEYTILPVVPDPDPVPPPASNAVPRYRVAYDPGEHGTLEGGGSEQVEKGSCPTKVPAVKAKEGWRFLGWSLRGQTELTNPSNMPITAATTFVAQYADKEVRLGFEREVALPYMVGLPDGTFRPDQTLTRAEAAVLLSRVLNRQAQSDQTYPCDYSDLTGEEWYAGPVSFLTGLNVLYGGEDGSFRGEDGITRAAFVAMVMRVDGTEGGAAAVQAPFPDVAGDHWARVEITLAHARGYINGLPDGGFHPEGELTRAEAATILNRVLSRNGAAGATLPFPDVPADHWAHSEILAATQP